MRTLAFALFTLAACSSSQPNAYTSGGDAGISGTAGGGAGGSGTGGSSTGGSGGSSGAIPVAPFTPGQPITAPSEQWTWIPFDDAFCGNGTTTGIGINPTTKSTRVLIFLEGGGACWNDITCNILHTASYFDTGYDAGDFNGHNGGFFDRSASTNPFKDYSYVYVPYCTGDIHAGASVFPFGNGKTGSFVGYNNITAYLDRLVPTFSSADRVILAGSSAGGFGALYNWWHVQQAFGAIRVDVIDDSGTPMPADIPVGNQPTWVDTWNLTATVPTGCTNCLQNLGSFLDFYDKQYPDHRVSLISYQHDSTLPVFFGLTQAQFDMGLQEDLSTWFTPGTNFRYFIAGGTGHVVWGNPSLTTSGVTLEQFLTQQVTDASDWASQM